MLLEIKNRVESELANYLSSVDQLYSLRSISPLLYKQIRDFASREGKRVRPILFILAYLGFSKKAAPGLYRSAIALELFHDFMLIHDDIIDKSKTRRGRPSVHAMLDKYLDAKKNIRFNGQDLAIVVGDVMYAMAIGAFLCVREDMRNKEKALRKLVEAGIYTGSGEFIELLYGRKTMEKMLKSDIYKVYDLKTANYTFASPLTMGAILAGASEREVKILFDYGMDLGRAFQIKDDILGTFSEEARIGKSNITDLKEKKKTVLIWKAYNNSGSRDRAIMKRIFSKSNPGPRDLLRIRKIISESGALDYARREVAFLIRRSERRIASSRMRLRYKNCLIAYSKKLLAL